MSNRLAEETSPYLLQHCDNPVDWYPWGPEALGRARDEDKPLLVSIGYSACHWCHVMERESFENPEVAALMNDRFVSVKVDREERPDVDSIYMEACQAMNGHGGWPLNAFITPDQVPFYVGTYFPPDARQGMPSWTMVLEAVAEAWNSRRDEIQASGEQVTRRLAGGALLVPSVQPLESAMLDGSVALLRERFDEEHGGFGGAPKFPPASAIEFLLRRGEREMTAATLRAMACGGIYDQIGGGFARYAVDAHWLVPHFEKMLYDNALLARAYLHGWQVHGDELFREVCEQTLDWMLLELRGEEGGFCSALDADSDGVEGSFYVWTPAELQAALADDRLYREALEWFGVTERGNFEGSNILTRGEGSAPARLAEIRATLYAVRADRVWPGLDDKRLTAWNALAITALAEAGAVLGRSDYLDAAVACADFVLTQLRDPEGRLLRTWKGEARLAAYLEDHAYLLEALLVLYEATFDERWFTEARSLADTILARFADPDRGGFFETADDHEQLLTRRKDLEDHPIPSANASAAYGLLRLAALTGEHTYEQAALGPLRLLHELAAQHPQAFSHLLQAIDFHLSPTREVALLGSDLGSLAAAVRERFRPHLVLAGGSGGESAVPLLEGRGEVDGQPAAYVCENFSCLRPVTDPAELTTLLEG